MEQWKDIPGYEGLYQVSNTGKVRSYSGRIKKASEKKISKCILPYQFVNLSSNNKQKKFFVHRLVMLAFVGPVPDGMIVKHKDDNPRNNRLDNLEYGTQSSNLQDCHDRKRRKTHANFIASSAKAAEKSKRSIRAFNESFDRSYSGIREAARQLGLRNGSIANVLSGRNHHHKGYKFEYA